MTSESTGIDVEKASDGRFGADPSAVYDVWDEFVSWAASAPRTGAVEVSVESIGAPVPFPKQVFALGLNYRDHAAETGLAIPEEIQVFTKWASAFTGPIAQVRLVEGDLIDWEVELVVVIGKGGRDIPEAQAWDHVAGLTMGQDISARRHQGRGTRQFSLAKSYRNYAPMGPVVVTPDELRDRDDIALGCSVDGETMQDGHSGEMIFPVPRAIADLSAIVELYPGDLIWTGTPAGVGQGRKRYLRAGERLDSWIEGIGTMSQTFID
ncbi:fumarylacetoacetate hydrolase family protein [Cumulibacter manganitolerans]|uniref:fumarylacetoacetate hydrolase family protein n=1 Tax=Cumulibacter manganitolerans TaxID=1884992 RepID=UPI001E52DDA0|nr:fumarylacetoacetate hydrolase family protein [Cumulibacter manganitolerans]